jgi:LacI family transcriptional regulator
MMTRQRRRAIQGATIRDVADRAGVSPMTVSRVINRESNVRAETRDLVKTAIRELNYSPSPAARSLAGSEPHRVGVLYHNPSTGYLSEFLLGVLDESSRTGTQIMVEKCTDRDLTGASLTNFLKFGAEGIILPPPLCESKPLLSKVRSAGIAVVAVAPGHPSPDLATVRIDNEAAARELTEHLLSLGHRRFGFITGHPNQTVSAQRLSGFLAALAEAGVDRQRVHVEQGYFTYRSGLEAAEKLLADRPRPTAIFAANDDMAAATSSVAHRLGLDVPSDISIVGFDDTPMATIIWPALTTIHQPVADMARAAVELVLEEIRRKRDGDKGPRQLLHPHRLMIRESSGPAPTAGATKAKT